MLKKHLGKRIAFLRREMGITQEQFAEKCNYSVEFISLVERGINAPSVAGLNRIAHVLKVEIKDLFDFKARKNERIYRKTNGINKKSP